MMMHRNEHFNNNRPADCTLLLLLHFLYSAWHLPGFQQKKFILLLCNCADTCSVYPFYVDFSCRTNTQQSKQSVQKMINTHIPHFSMKTILKSDASNVVFSVILEIFIDVGNSRLCYKSVITLVAIFWLLQENFPE